MKLYKFKIVYILLVSALVVLGACRSHKNLPRTSRKAIAKDNALKLAAIQQAQVSFNTLSLKAKASLMLGESDNDATINIRVQKDQKIWATVTAIAGLEVARVLITPDSIKILNRLEGIYIEKPFTFIHSYTNGELDFGTLQAILVGNNPDLALRQTPLFEVQDSTLNLSGQASGLSYRLKFNDLMKVKDVLLEDEAASRKLNIDYSDFYMDAGAIFPHQVKFKSAVANKKIQIELKYTKIEKDLELDYPFTVPKRFSVKN